MAKLKLETSKSNLVLYVLLILSFGFFAFQVYGKSIEGLFLFNPSAGVIPFQVDASKTGRVDNLNADRVDDLHAADLMAAGGGGVYTAYDRTTCAPGWTVVYTGVLMSSSLWWTNSYIPEGGGGIVCKEGSAFPVSSPYGVQIYWTTGGVSSRNVVMGCAVCAK